MVQAIEAIYRNGVITPIDPVTFEEAEHVVIVRMPKAVSNPHFRPVRGAMKGMLSSVESFIAAKESEIALEETP